MIFRLVPSLVHEMGDAYPELVRAQPLITETLKLEEGRFKTTLGTGLKLLDDETRGLSAGGTLRGDVAFKLYDTFGFPLDLTQDVLRARDIAVDTAGFDKAMDEQRAKARAAWAGSGETADQAIWFDVRQKTGATEFLGYDTERAEGQIKTIVRDGKEVSALEAGQTGWIIVNQTPFYAESGGQQGDTGRFIGANGEAAIADVQKRVSDLHAHHATISKGELKVGDDVVMTIDPIRRAQLRAHHSATHLLHEALRRHLGEHVTQKGSLVAPDRLRFDISHTKAISLEELRRIEDEVNDRIRHNSAVQTRLMTPEEAIAAGAMALFGEKYGEEVRVLSNGRRGRFQIFGRAVRRHACAAHRRYRPVPNCRRGRGRGRRSPHRSGRGCRGRGACAPPGAAAGRRGGRAQGAARGSAGPPAGAGRRPAQGRARALGCPQGAGAGRLGRRRGGIGGR